MGRNPTFVGFIATMKSAISAIFSWRRALADALYFDEISAAGHMERDSAGDNNLDVFFKVAGAAGGIDGDPNHFIDRVRAWNQERNNSPTQRQEVQCRLVRSRGQDQLPRSKAGYQTGGGARPGGS